MAAGITFGSLEVGEDFLRDQLQAIPGLTTGLHRKLSWGIEAPGCCSRTDGALKAVGRSTPGMIPGSLLGSAHGAEMVSTELGLQEAHPRSLPAPSCQGPQWLSGEPPGSFIPNAGLKARLQDSQIVF